uniref:Uncharacterized protein n=1 Tax=Arundo donax TaxID=35708 RepID=A0A0A9B6S2_ARUDO
MNRRNMPSWCTMDRVSLFVACAMYSEPPLTPMVSGS